MRIIKFIFYSLLALSLIACTGIFVFLETFDTDQYLPQITKKVSLALGRPVSIGHMGIGVSLQGITLDAAPLIIADDANFTTEPFIKADRVRIGFDLKRLILQREVRIKDILVQSPEIHFIRSFDGHINAQSIMSVPKGPVPLQVLRTTANDTIKAEAMPSAIDVKVQDASISFIDQSRSIPLDIWLSNINASMNGVSASKPFRLSFNASFYSDDPNVHGSALVSLDPSKRSVSTSGMSLHTDFFRLDIEGLRDISPEMPDNFIFKNITGAAQLNLVHLGIGAGGVQADGNILITNALIKDFNIIKIVLSQALGVFGDMDGIIKKLGADDTVIKKAGAQFSYHDKTFFIDNSLIKTNILEFTAKGSFDQGLNMDMETMLRVNADVSADLINEFGGLRFFGDDTKRIAIGASLKGIFPHLKYKPNKDFKKQSRKAFMAAGGSILGALLGGR